MGSRAVFAALSALSLAGGSVFMFAQDASYHGGNCFDMCAPNDIASIHVQLAAIGAVLAVGALALGLLLVRRRPLSRDFLAVAGYACITIALVGVIPSLYYVFFGATVWPVPVILGVAGVALIVASRSNDSRRTSGPPRPRA